MLSRGLEEVWVAGGGAYNQTLMRRLRELLPVPVYTNSKVREALA